MVSFDFDVVVVGGGLAGLAAGATAAQGGASTVVLEAHQPGGRARTTERDGFAFNLGPHALFAGGHGMTVLRSLGVRPTGAPPPMDRYEILAGGEHYPLPLGDGPGAGASYLDARDRRQLDELFGLLQQAHAPSLAGLSVGAWLSTRDLRPRVDALVRALFRLSTYVADLDELGADAGVAQQQIAAASGVIYLHGGWVQLVDALRSKVEVRSGTSVRGVASDAGGAVVHTDDGPITARAVVVAAGTPRAVRSMLADDPEWPDLGEPVTAACLDVALLRPPSPGYLVGLDEPLYATTQSPPARQAPGDSAVAAVIRYGARRADDDRRQLEEHLRVSGVKDGDVVARRFLARMVVMGAMPRAATGGLAGRPSITATGLPGVFLAGDWVGPDGLLSDAALASGQAAGVAAARRALGLVSVAA